MDSIDVDTGFNFKCSACCQYKGLATCQSIASLTDELQETFLFLNDLTISKDGNFYVCISCKNMIKNGKMSPKENRSFKILETFPSSLEEKLRRECHFQDLLLANKERFGESRISTKYLFPNKLEDFLLKLIIPFCRIGHCPRGRYLQVSFLN